MRQTLFSVFTILFLFSLGWSDLYALSEKEKVLKTNQDLILELEKVSKDPMKVLLEFYMDYKTDQLAQINGFRDADDYRKALRRHINNNSSIQATQNEINKLIGILLSEEVKMPDDVGALSEKERVVNAVRQLVDELERIVNDPDSTFDQVAFEKKMEEIAIANGFANSNALDEISKKFANDVDILKEQKRVEDLLPKLMEKAMQGLGIDDPGQLEESNRISDEELKIAVDSVYNIVVGYYDVIEENLHQPGRAVAVGRTYLDNVKPALEVLFQEYDFKNYSEDQYWIIEEFQEKLEHRINEAVEKIRSQLGSDEEAMNQIQSQMQELMEILMESAESN